jgi:hypothetical protein
MDIIFENTMLMVYYCTYGRSHSTLGILEIKPSLLQLFAWKSYCSSRIIRTECNLINNT